MSSGNLPQTLSFLLLSIFSWFSSLFSYHRLGHGSYGRHNLCVLFSLLLCGLLLGGCSSLQESDWPRGIPAQSYFLEYYEQDAANQVLQSEADYLRWIKRFYTGLPPIPGWLELSEQAMGELSSGVAQELQNDTYRLGRDISAEWAKNDQVRRIDTRMINIWRDAFLEARNRSEVLKYLDLWQADVNDLLSGELSDDDIYFERYYVDEFDF